MDQRSNGRRTVQECIDKFQANRAAYINASYNETQLRMDFLDDFLGALGWDVQNSSQLPQRLREVIVEESIVVENEAAKKKPDFTLRRNGERLLFVEAKKPNVSIATARDPAFQTRRYGWSAEMPISVLTNFDKLVIYDCTRRPVETDDAHVGRIQIYDHTEYADRFDEIYDQLSRESAYSGRFDENFTAHSSRTGSERFDHYFLHQIEEWRRQLAQSLAVSNRNLRVEDLNFLVQRLINRIVFLRICEDRGQETYQRLRGVQNYEQLKALFRNADRRYNSGLFDFLEDTLSFNVEVDSGILIGIFEQLYVPVSPYNFAVVDPSVLGEIYEQFLAKQVTLALDGNVNILDKPEVVQSGGVVSTPKQVADRIVAETLQPMCEAKSPEQINQMRIADIACGSGVFLLSIYEYLLDHRLSWFIEHESARQTNSVYQTAAGQWRLTLIEKHLILNNCIYGVDIDIQAVEISRFSLLLKVLENEDLAYIDAQLEASQGKALPNLDNNIQCGNSLVDSTFYRFDQDTNVSEHQLVAINPFDWSNQFPNVMRSGGFDAIVGNPPYIRIQNMVLYSPKEVAYFQSSSSPYRTARQNSFDKYAIFIERAISLLKSEGRLGYIVPHKFLTILAGQALRSLLSENQYVEHVGHFGVQQVFSGRSTYTCILYLSKKVNPTVTVEHVTDVFSWKQGGAGIRSEMLSETLNGAQWIFVAPRLQELFDRIQHSSGMRPLSAAADIIVGLQTSADRLYIIKPNGEQNGLVTFTDRDGNHQAIESDMLRPCLLDAPIEPFGSPIANKSIIFPYRVEDGRAMIYSEQEMETQFPHCLAYLHTYKQSLSERKINGGDPAAWYRFGRSQSLAKFDGRPKLIWPVLSREPRYGYDSENILFTGGGNGPYYALRPKAGESVSIFYLLAILSHPLIELMVRSSGSAFQGGYVSHGKQFMKPLPVPIIDPDNKYQQKLYETIVRTTEQLVRSTQDGAAATAPQIRTIHRRRSDVLRRQVEESVGNLYGLTSVDMNLLAAITTGTDSEDETQEEVQ